jgi:hypothetical protein
MASSLALIFHEDGSIEATPELKQRFQLMRGARLELVGQEGAEFRFRAPAAMREIHDWRDLDGILARPKTAISLPDELDSNPMSLRGFLRDADVDPNAYLAAEKTWELAREEWLYGPYTGK